MTPTNIWDREEAQAESIATYREQVGNHCNQLIHKFRTALRKHVGIYTLFGMAAFIELVALVTLLPFLIRTSVMAIGLAVLFLTGFSYFIVRLYLQTKKPEQLLDLRDEFIQACKDLLFYQEGIPDHHLSLANATSRLAGLLHQHEYTFYSPPASLAPLTPFLEKLGCWCHWEDVLVMRELLLEYAIDELIKVVRIEPTNLDVHAALANAYVMLSSLYVDPTHDTQLFDRWVPASRYSDEIEEQFRLTAQRAIEEFKILSSYAPDDPWVHEQLAYSYRDLQMPQEEIQEYETILRLRPDDIDTLFQLGVRYFQCGETAKGLEVYEALRHHGHEKANDLLQFYGASL